MRNGETEMSPQSVAAGSSMVSGISKFINAIGVSAFTAIALSVNRWFIQEPLVTAMSLGIASSIAYLKVKYSTAGWGW